jgi:hypothetical protein
VKQDQNHLNVSLQVVSFLESLYDQAPANHGISSVNYVHDLMLISHGLQEGNNLKVQIGCGEQHGPSPGVCGSSLPKFILLPNNKGSFLPNILLIIIGDEFSQRSIAGLVAQPALDLIGHVVEAVLDSQVLAQVENRVSRHPIRLWSSGFFLSVLFRPLTIWQF